MLGVQVLVGAEAVLMMIIGGLLEDKRVEHARLVEAAVENDAMLTRLRRAQHRYELATASGAVGVWDVDLEDGRFHIDSRLKARLGYGEHEIQDRTGAWMQLIWPVDQGEVRSQLAAMRTGVSNELDAECRVCQRDGSCRWFAIKGAVTERVGGVATRATGTYTDITERKAADAALREAFRVLVPGGRFVILEFSTPRTPLLRAAYNFYFQHILPRIRSFALMHALEGAEEQHRSAQEHDGRGNLRRGEKHARAASGGRRRAADGFQGGDQGHAS